MEVKRRHAIVTAWLVLMIAYNFLTFLGFHVIRLLSFVIKIIRQENSIEYLSRNFDIQMGLLGLVSTCKLVFLIILLHQSKKWAFWAYLATGIVTIIINLDLINNGVEFGIFSIGLVSAVLLFGILQIKKEGVSAWEQLK